MPARPAPASRPSSPAHRSGALLIAICCLGSGAALAAGRQLLLQLAPPLNPSSSSSALLQARKVSVDPERRRQAALLLSSASGTSAAQRRQWLRGQGWGPSPLAAASLKQAALAAEATGHPQEAAGLWQSLLRRFPKAAASADALYALGRQQPALRQTLLQRFAAHPAALAAAVEGKQALHLARWGARWPGAETLLLEACSPSNRPSDDADRRTLAAGLSELGHGLEAQTCLAKTPADRGLQLQIARSLLKGSAEQQSQGEEQLLALALAAPHSPEAREATLLLADSPDAKSLARLQQLPPKLQDNAAVQARLAQAGLSPAEAVLRRWPRDPASWQLQWDKARDALLKRQWAEASRWLSAVPPKTLPAPLAARQLFWQGYSAEQRGQQRQAAALWKQTIQAQPLGYYSWRARVRLGLDPSSWPAAPEGRQGEPWHNLKSGYADLDLLWSAGQALEAWETWRVRQQGRPPQTAQDLLIEGRLRTAIGDDWTGLGQLERASLRLPQINCQRQLQREQQSHPLRFQESLAKAAAAATVDPNLLLAVAKQESRFSPAVASPVGALGLMQLMPETAAELAGGPISPAQLKDPERNAELGARYLKQLMAGASADLFRVVASYNAGPGAVASWIKPEGFDLEREPELWAEAIPYPETRLYTKKVLGNYWSYKLLNQPAHRLCRA
ncbi:MAG: transglycosylase SLT domain-containing protein [Vulcanococcus sp.]